MLPILDPSKGSLGDALSVLALAFKSQGWMILTGLVLAALVIVLRTFDLMQKVPAEWVPWATIGLATVTSVAVGLQTGRDLSTILVTGIGVGIAAIGGYESLGKLAKAALEKLRAPKVGG